MKSKSDKDVDAMLAEWNASARPADIRTLPVTKEILAAEQSEQSLMVEALIGRLKQIDSEGDAAIRLQMRPARRQLLRVLETLLGWKLPLPAEVHRDLIEWCCSAKDFNRMDFPLPALTQSALQLREMESHSEGSKLLAARVLNLIELHGIPSIKTGEMVLALRSSDVVSNPPRLLPLERWARAALVESARHSADGWRELWEAAVEMQSGQLSSKRQRKMLDAIHAIGGRTYAEVVAEWLQLAAVEPEPSDSEMHGWKTGCVFCELERRRGLLAPALLPGSKWWLVTTRFLEAADHSPDPWNWLLRFRFDPVVIAAFGGSVPEMGFRARMPEFDDYSWSQQLESNRQILVGLIISSGLACGAEIVRTLTTLALSAYRKVPGKGPRAVRVGNACITALGMIGGVEAVGQLAVLKVKVKFGTAQKQIEKAMAACAEKAGIPRDELEEMSVPAYGLTEVGWGTESLGDHTAELVVRGLHDVALLWRGPDGKERKSLPAAVKAAHRDELKELTAAKKDIERMLPAQAERLDSLFLAQKEWALDYWREHYLQHPLVGVLVRRLVWNFTTSGVTTPGVWFKDQLVDRTGAPVPLEESQTRVTMWHPLEQTAEEVLAWRTFLEEREIRQPFKQAHREVYLLTPAEEQTGVYSNRFAAHVLRQHQFNALCAARGWKNKLRLSWDNDYPAASRTLPAWGLRAEFWIDGAGEETNEANVFLHVATDQVRFYRQEAEAARAHAFGGGYRGGGEPLRLAEVPRLVFSEIMRDVDLFVGVTSVGNDPAWRDGGRREQFGDQWRHFAFGDLTATAQTRREVLQRLVPKLKIAGQCSFDDKFLVVRGTLHTYRIHLGSGNILMSPNDQYLCIVPARGVADTGAQFLPFEGDGTLSLILSKALLLAADDKITDPAITRQL